MGTRSLASLTSLASLALLVSLTATRASAAGEAIKGGVQIAAADAQAAAAPGKPGVIEGAVINPFQNANVGAEVSGILADFSVNEGDLVQKGQVVAQISPEHYALLARRDAAARQARRLELKGFEEDESAREKLLALHATTQLSLIEAQNKREVAHERVREADAELALANFSIEQCKVRAPFTGHLAVRYKQPFEPVDRLEKIFAVVDSSKVFAVGNLPEDLLDRWRVGQPATFAASSGKRFTGKIERLATLIDPQSRTKRVFILIDNAGGELQVGMTGSIALGE